MPDRHNHQQHRSTLANGTNVTAGYVPTAQGDGTVEWEAGGSGVTDHDDLTGRDSVDNHSTYLTNVAGEGHVTAVVADAGSTETLDLSTANVFDVTLTTGCTLTLTPPTDDGKARTWSLVFRGSFLVGWPAEVVWVDGDGTAPAAVETLAVLLMSLDGGASYMATAGRGVGSPLSDDTPLVESGSGSAGTSDEGSRSDHVHPATAGGEILISDTPSTPLVFADLIQNEAQDDLVYADP